ncbi:MAG: UTP--glucose-1-phosphate uridylyltransferase [Acidobacteriota bacterium]|nr:UTP--glucose-1-phosphate uridylyltransferase [Acidobacteriota bacterium]
MVLAQDETVRNSSMDAFCRRANGNTLLEEAQALDLFRRTHDNLYERVRAQFFLYAIYRFHLPAKSGVKSIGLVPFSATTNILKRRFEEAVDILLEAQLSAGPNGPVCSGLAAAYHGLGFQTLAGQVRRSVRSVRGNEWMSRIGHPADYPLSVRPELLNKDANGNYPILCEATPVRMDLSHSAWSDIFFLGMDLPQGARVLNASIDLAVRGSAAGDPQPPIETYLRVIDDPVLRLTSVDLSATADVTTFAELVDFGSDYLGLLKAAVIASGIVPQAMEVSSQPLSDLLRRLVGHGRGIEIVSRVRDIPKGSRLAVSTNLLASLICVSMRATNQIHALTGPLKESDRRLIAARAILGEWLGGSGGGWQDSGGIWPGLKLIRGVEAGLGDPEYGISRGCLLPTHELLSGSQVSAQLWADVRDKLQRSIVLVHGGMAQDVGPLLETVTEKYLLRSQPEWAARLQATGILSAMLEDLRGGDIRALASATEQNFFGPIQTIIPWASNVYTEALIQAVRTEFQSDFWGFWMLGGMAGGGMGFFFSPEKKSIAEERLQAIMEQTKRRLESAVSFSTAPVVYDFAVNAVGSSAQLLSGAAALMPSGYYTLMVPALLRTDPQSLSASRRAELENFAGALRVRPEMNALMHSLFDRLLPHDEPHPSNGSRTLRELLSDYGFDPVQHDRIQSDLRSGRIGLAQNRLATSATIEDVRAKDVFDASAALDGRFAEIGRRSLEAGEIAVVSLAGGAGTRWTHGAGVVKALNPFCKFGGQFRSFLDIQLAKTRRSSREFAAEVPHVITTSYLTHRPIQTYVDGISDRTPGRVILSRGNSIGLRMIPMTRDLRFQWEETQQQILDERKQKARESAQSAWLTWAQRAGEGRDYADNLPAQCLHPTGHWYEIPNMLRNGVLMTLLNERPQLRCLMIHNIDTVGVSLDPALLGIHIDGGAAITTEVIARHLEDRGGGLARVDGRLRLVEGLALPSEEIESSLSYYNSSTTWIDVAQLLAAFSLDRADLADEKKTSQAIRHLASRMPTYITIKNVKKRWGKGQEDVFPVTQYEKLWGDMTALPGLKTAFVAVPRFRGQQLKDVAQLDGWMRDGSAQYVDSLCEWD